MSLADRLFIQNCRDIIENGTWAPMAAKVMKGMLEGCKDITWLDTTVSIKSAVKQQNIAELESMAKELC